MGSADFCLYQRLDTYNTFNGFVPQQLLIKGLFLDI